MIWLFDLDNTLVDRQAAFRAWAAGEVGARGGDDADLAAIVAADDGGFSRKEDLAAVVRERLGWELSVPETIAAFRAGIRANIAAYPGVAGTLDTLRARGEKTAVVTNGVAHQQRGKLALSGIDRRVDAVVVSGEVGVEKPDPRMVALALEALGETDAPRDAVWMIGDAAHADVAVGQAAGVRTAWISHGRVWDGAAERPDIAARSTVAAIAEISRRS
ncbi:HAD family hydrolase [Myceligenerans indicum]|uniref:HAD family hydrolase n=1 Tax=Myceligenerans indicum TaxID=2593663 RepID=A0ABS1LG10_9MICO|nr:HAD family hydrolase [Myceligenerans indicum]MBL0885164.1 HAD family hydrolase [Myceligenerans indicum]